MNPLSRGKNGTRRALQVDSILEEIKSLTLMEAAELVSMIEETFGVDASAAAAPQRANRRRSRELETRCRDAP